MPTQLTNVKARFISILTDDMKPANRRSVIVKSEKGDQDGTIEIFAKLEKFDDIKGLLYVEPMVGIEKDTDDEYYFNETVEKTAHDTLKNAIIKADDVDNPIDTNHNYKQLDNVYLVESHVDKSGDVWLWKAVMDIHENEELMQKARDGKINGVSIAGSCNKIPDELFKAKHFEDRINNFIEKGSDFDSMMEDVKNTDIYMPMSVMWDAINKAYYAMAENDPAGFKKEVKLITKQFNNYIGKMSFKIKKSTKKGEEEMELTNEVKVEIQEMIKTSFVDLSKSLEEKIVALIPTAPTVKNDEGKEVPFDVVDVITNLAKSVKALQENKVIKSETVNEKIQALEKELSELKKDNTTSGQGADDTTEVPEVKITKQDSSEFDALKVFI